MIHYGKTNNMYMKDYDTIIELSYLIYWDLSNLYRSQLSQRLLVNGFKWKKDRLKFDKTFIQHYDKDSNKITETMHP